VRTCGHVMALQEGQAGALHRAPLPPTGRTLPALDVLAWQQRKRMCPAAVFEALIYRAELIGERSESPWPTFNWFDAQC